MKATETSHTSCITASAIAAAGRSVPASVGIFRFKMSLYYAKQKTARKCKIALEQGLARENPREADILGK
jgi:hypothetical protein